MMGRRSLLLFTRTALSGLMNMLGTAIVARLMGAEALGTVGYLMGLVGMLSIISDLGYSVAYVRRVAGLDDIADDIGTFSAIKVVLAALLILAVMLTPVLDQHFSRSLLKLDHVRPLLLIGLFYVTGELASIFLRTFAARLEAAKLAVAGLGGSLLLLTARALVAWRGWGITGLSAAAALQGIGYLTLGLFLFRGYRIGRPSLALLREYTAYAWPQMALIIITTATSNIDRTMLGRLSGAAQVGYYVGVLGVLTLATEMVRSVMSLLFPRVSQDAKAADYESMHRRLKGALKYLLLIIVPLAGAGIIMRDWLVRIYLGPGFGAAAPVVAVLGLTVIPATLSRPYQQVLFAVEQHRHMLEVRLVGLAVLVVAGVLLIPHSLFDVPLAGLGAVGVAVAVLLKDTIECLYVICLSARYVGIGFWKETLWFLLGGTALVAVGSAVLLAAAAPSLAIQVLAVAVGTASYLAVLYAGKQFRRAELALLLDTINPIKLLRYIRSELRTVGQDADHSVQETLQDLR